MSEQSSKIEVHLHRLEDYGLEIPCRQACPVNTGAGQYVREIAAGRYLEGYLNAIQPNPLASVCARICAAPCEDNCRRGNVDTPVSIRALKRFVCELYENVEITGKKNPAAFSVNQSGKKVAVIGGGPAGISCSHVLADLGYQVTIFESSERLGGALWKFIPAYRLPRSVIDRELESLTSKNVEVRLECGLNETMNLDILSGQGFQAFFLACGADRSLDLAIEGRDARGVYKAIDYLNNINRNIKVELGEKVVVIGGGSEAVDVAQSTMRPAFEDDKAFAASDPGLSGIDAARCAIKSGAGSVIMASLESLERMPAVQSGKGKEELREAQNEGVKLMSGVGPRKILVEGGKVVGVEFMEIEYLFDDADQYAPTFKHGSEMRIEADSVIMAIGRVPNLFFLDERDGVELTPKGRLKVDPETLQTSALDVFGGGDCVFTPGIIVEAVADGKQVAASIHKFLQSGEIKEKLAVNIRKLNPDNFRSIDCFDAVSRQMPAMRPLAERALTVEVEKSYDEAMAREQAGRCLDCYIQTVYDPELCILCGACIGICPGRCLSFVNLDCLVAGEDGTAAFLEAHTTSGALGLIKDDDSCIRCGLCVRVCSSSALTMERLQTSIETVKART